MAIDPTHTELLLVQISINIEGKGEPRGISLGA